MFSAPFTAGERQCLNSHLKKKEGGKKKKKKTRQKLQGKNNQGGFWTGSYASNRIISGAYGINNNKVHFQKVSSSPF